MNKLKASPAPKKVAHFFHTLGQPVRVRILMAIGHGETCVCHLEAALGQRQAYISQHLMALRQAGLVTTRRDGRNVYYRLDNPGLLSMIEETARLAGIPETEFVIGGPQERLTQCTCPHCSENPITDELPIPSAAMIQR